MGVLGVTVNHVLISSESENTLFATQISHTPHEETNNYAHTDIEVPVPPQDFSKNGRRKAAKHWRTLLDERLNGDGSNPNHWKQFCLREARPK